jgi:hypothetical protein
LIILGWTAASSTFGAGATLPGGGTVLFPGKRLVALYGHPGTPALGALGEQGIAASVTRVEQLAAQYQPLSSDKVVPAFEIIATVADSSPGPSGDYSDESSVDSLLPWVDAARRAGIYVILDLQPGRANLLTQAEHYSDLLAQPNVGLALDAEWKLGPQQLPGKQVGSVSIDEVNSVVDWLAGFTRMRGLPQKLLMLHQFRLSMIKNRQQLDTSNSDLAIVVHADGFGTPEEKLKAWNVLHEDAPSGIHWGWKNFFKEDHPMFTPAQTLALEPAAPVVISYQ